MAAVDRRRRAVPAHRGRTLTDEQREQLAARGIAVVDGEVRGLAVVGDRLTGVRLADGEVVPRAALVVATRDSTARADLLADARRSSRSTWR